METKLLLDVTALRNEIRAGSELVAESTAAEPTPSHVEMAPTQPEWDIVEPELETVSTSNWSDESVAELDHKYARTEPMLSINATVRSAADGPESQRTEAAPRRYARLFTRLRERRAAAEQETAAWPLRLWR
jgi:hypothetical protein